MVGGGTILHISW